jgi:flagella basal body P-ring formation protein FlgA
MKIARILFAAMMSAAGPAAADTLPAATNAGTRIVVPAHAIARGDIITDGDLTYSSVPPGQLLGGAVTDMSDLSGRQARRMLREGEAVRASDVRAPILVTKGSTVTMTFAEPGITLTAVGKAMSEGGMGESVTVLNPVSYRQIVATVTGPGTVAAGDASMTVSAAVPAQLAAIQN